MLDNLKIQKNNYSMHGKYELDVEQDRVPRVEFVDDDEIDEVRSIQFNQDVVKGENEDNEDNEKGNVENGEEGKYNSTGQKYS